MKFDLIVCGAAGQGIITLSRIILRAAVSEGFDAKMVSFFGIAKTEGPVVTHVRIGNPSGPSPKIPAGKADAIIAMDRLEAVRHERFLRPGGLVVVDETGAPPVNARFGGLGYPSVDHVKETFADARVIWVPATLSATALGDSRMGGAVLLGAMAALTQTLDRDSLVMSVRTELPAKADSEAEAFFKGISFITGKDD